MCVNDTFFSGLDTIKFRFSGSCNCTVNTDRERDQTVVIVTSRILSHRMLTSVKAFGTYRWARIKKGRQEKVRKERIWVSIFTHLGGKMGWSDYYQILRTFSCRLRYDFSDFGVEISRDIDSLRWWNSGKWRFFRPEGFSPRFCLYMFYF